jgi:hypothetical protein
MKYFWSLFLIFLGTVILGAEIGIYSWWKLAEVARLWPSLLIIAGLNLLIKGIKYSNIITFFITLVFFTGIVAYLFYGWTPMCPYF